ncbi:MAG: hypothetical protein DBY17_06850 [Oscillospiraceae bacterium]|nr:MAG: hypothetical protein DBY17_06850 [Oscillospiraceae bacterium]
MLNLSLLRFWNRFTKASSPGEPVVYTGPRCFSSCVGRPAAVQTGDGRFGLACSDIHSLFLLPLLPVPCFARIFCRSTAGALAPPALPAVFHIQNTSQAPGKAAQGSRCSGCPYWRGIGCVSCYRELMRAPAGGK